MYERVPDRGQRVPDAARRDRPVPPPAATPLLALHRHAGNTAVAQLVSKPASAGRRVQRVVHPEYKAHWTEGLELGLLKPDHVRTARDTVRRLQPTDRQDGEIRAFVTDPPEKGALKSLRRLVAGERQTDHHARAWRALAEAGFDLAAARARLESDPPRAVPTGRKREELTEAYVGAILARLEVTSAQRRAFAAFWAMSDPGLRWAVLVRVLPEVAGVGLRPLVELAYVFESVDPKRRHNSFWQGASGWFGTDWLERREPGESLFQFADRRQSGAPYTTERHDKTTRSRYRMSFANGLMTDAAGAVPDDEYLFVVDAAEHFFAAPGKGGVVSRHHSSFLGGRAVRAAGSLQVRGGRIAVLSDQSGHYKPTKQQVLLALRTLQKLGVNLSTFLVSLHGAPKDVPAHFFLLEETSAPGRRHRDSRMRSDANAPPPQVQALTGLSAVGW